jgi:hypothetical protein
VIVQEFKLARHRLQGGWKFEQVMDPNDRVDRPFDNKSLENRFNNHNNRR